MPSWSLSKHSPAFLHKAAQKRLEKYKYYAKKLDNPGEMDKFLETYKVSKLSHEETENLNRPITSNEIESVIKTLQTNKSPGQMASQMNSFFFFIFLMFVYFWETEREWGRAESREREREGHTDFEAGSRLSAVSTEPDTGLELTNREIMTWAEVWCPNDWAT